MKKTKFTYFVELRDQKTQVLVSGEFRSKTAALNAARKFLVPFDGLPVRAVVHKSDGELRSLEVVETLYPLVPLD